MPKIDEERVVAEITEELRSGCFQPPGREAGQQIPLLAELCGGDAEQRRSQPGHDRAEIAGAPPAPAQAGPFPEGRIQQITGQLMIDDEDRGGGGSRQPDGKAQNDEAKKTGRGNHMQDAEPDIFVGRDHPRDGGDGDRREDKDHQPPGPGAPVDPGPVCEIEADPGDEEKTRRHARGKDAPDEEIGGGRGEKTEEFQIPDPMETDHAEQGQPAQPIHEGEARNRSRGWGRRSDLCAHLRC